MKKKNDTILKNEDDRIQQSKSFGQAKSLLDSKCGAPLMLKNPNSENGSIFKSETLMENSAKQNLL